jgi:hypothetical protein
MVIWNFLDGGLSHNGPLLKPVESMRGGTPGTNSCHMGALDKESLTMV